MTPTDVNLKTVSSTPWFLFVRQRNTPIVLLTDPKIIVGVVSMCHVQGIMKNFGWVRTEEYEQLSV